MSKKTKNPKSKQKTTTNRPGADPSDPADSRALENSAGPKQEPGEPPMTSPYRLMALLFGIPLAVLAAAIFFRMLT
ncbi:MAG: hypothetical protein ABI333_19685 [bacterium]